MQLTATKKRIKISYRIAEKIEKIKTLEGEMMALVGDYIITGINGEVYPCKPDIFLKTYDLEGQENQSPLTQEDREPRQNWEYEFKKRFSDMVTSAIWYTPVKEFIINLLAAKDREADERVAKIQTWEKAMSEKAVAEAVRLEREKIKEQTKYIKFCEQENRDLRISLSDFQRSVGNSEMTQRARCANIVRLWHFPSALPQICIDELANKILNPESPEQGK